MENTYTQVHIHCVFAVKFRRSLIHVSWKNKLHQYIGGTIQRQRHKLITINSMPDHIHILFGLRPMQSISDLMRIVKGDSSEWINKNHLAPCRFQWQEGFGAFSYAKSQLKTVADYIDNQEKHHASISFLEEYKKTLDAFEVEYKNQYLFHEPM
jgi:putative transposase